MADREAAAATPRHWRDWLRHDPSDVAPLGSYAAKQCPVRTQLDVLQPGERATTPEFIASLGDVGIEWEADVTDHLADLHGMETVEVAASRADREAQTVAAMRAGARLIAGGRLPVDEEGRRVGEPDLLVRVGDAPVDGRWRYAPVDVKSHMILRDRGKDVVVQAFHDLAVPDADTPTRPVGRPDRKAREDCLQLAHYHRILQALGHAADGSADSSTDGPTGSAGRRPANGPTNRPAEGSGDGAADGSAEVSGDGAASRSVNGAAAGPAWGGIIGSEGWCAWFRLDVPMWPTPTADEDARTKDRTALEMYDFEFAFRLDIAAVATRHLADPSVGLLVEPVACNECPACPWRNQCLPALEEAEDPSLLPRVGYAQWRALRDAGLRTISEVAALPADANVEGLGKSKLADLRLQATAWLSDEPVTPRGPSLPAVPTADVEVDVDMENIAAGAYLWGTLVTLRSDAARAKPGLHPQGYRGFVTWEAPLDDGAVADVFTEFWDWLVGVRAACHGAGLTFSAFCWSESAENRFLRIGGDLTGRRDEVDDFTSSDEWIDLLQWFNAGWVTGHGSSLKTVATRLGFEWRDDDPGGAASTLWYADAVDETLDEESRHTARTRLLAYNEDDVAATLAVRDRLRPLAAG